MAEKNPISTTTSSNNGLVGWAMWKSQLQQVGSAIKDWMKQSFDVDTNSVYKTPENDEEKKKIKKIRNFNLIEFLVSLLGMFTIMWTLWWQGVKQDNDIMLNTGFALIGLIGIWALLISPFVHYHIEKDIIYRPGYLGLNYEQNYWTAWFEERGFGSLKRHWENLRKGEKIHLINYMTLVVILTIILIMYDSPKYMINFMENFSLQEPLLTYTAIVGLLLSYHFIGFLIFVYGFYLAATWKDTGNLDLFKRVGLIVISSIAIIFTPFVWWGFGISYDVNHNYFVRTGWENYPEAFELTVRSGAAVAALVSLIVLFIIGFFLIKYLVLGILIRFDNLKTSSFWGLFVSGLALVLIFMIWGLMSTNAANAYIVAHNKDNMVDPPEIGNMWYIFDNTAWGAMNEANFAGFIGNWAGYIYWGLAQEWLFLGYWCTLLTKISRNKYLNALLSSATFGLIHFPSWPLMIFTMIAGFFWAIAWQRNDSRNLFMMGVIHGFGGTLVAKFIPITMSVGPSNMS